VVVKQIPGAPMHRAHANGQSTYLAPPKARAYDQPMDELLVAHTPNGVATLTLNRPDRKNALSVSLRDVISDALDHFADDADTKAVVLTGSGNVFSASLDLKEFEIPAGTRRHYQRTGSQTPLDL
jgi:enoyl-CoA hydratase/carnithine racemase